MATDYRSAPEDDQVALLARTLPDGRLWAAKYDETTVLGRLVRGLATGITRSAERVENFVVRELDPNQTHDLILEWEESVGIPDECFDRADDLATRRQHVVQKLQNFGFPSTNDEIRAVLAGFGFTVSIEPGEPGVNEQPLGFPAGPHTADQERQINHTVAIRSGEEELTFDYTFDIDFVAGSIQLRCLCERLFPANIDLVFLFDQDLGTPVANP